MTFAIISEAYDEERRTVEMLRECRSQIRSELSKAIVGQDEAVGLHRGGDEPQIARGGLVERQQLHALLVDFDVVGADLLVAIDDLLGQIAVALEERAHDPADLVLDQASHGQQGLLERVQLFVEMALHSRALRPQPKRPVM